jgi:hypothetical protein
MQLRMAGVTLDQLPRPLTNDTIFDQRASFLPLNAFRTDSKGSQSMVFSLRNGDTIGATAEFFQSRYMSTPIPVSEDFIEVRFGRLSPTSYAQLVGYFGLENAQQYDASRSYDLIDFLQPKLQALVNRTGSFFGPRQCFDVMVSYVISPNDRVMLTTNGFEIYANLLGDAQYFTRIELSTELATNAQKLEKSMQLGPGDVILFGSPDPDKPFGLSAGHAATVLADSIPTIIWEKKAPKEQAFALNTLRRSAEARLTDNFEMRLFKRTSKPFDLSD